ncbi:hypothetical protein P8452_52452 [Trifolium repens]|nr:hypothetical protein P8452_52452 [Trifolium repens]
MRQTLSKPFQTSKSHFKCKSTRFFAIVIRIKSHKQLQSSITTRLDFLFVIVFDFCWIDVTSMIILGPRLYNGKEQEPWKRRRVLLDGEHMARYVYEDYFISKEGLSKPTNMFGSRQRRNIVSHMFENELPSEQPQPDQCPKKRSNLCITQEQIEELDVFFKLKDHPNESERKELGHRLGLDPSQVKFWFWNKRTKLKILSQREENKALKEKNEKLRAENAILRAQMNRFKETNMCGPQLP